MATEALRSRGSAGRGVAAGMMKSQLGCAGSAVTGLKNQNPVNAVSGLGGMFKKKKP